MRQNSGINLVTKSVQCIQISHLILLTTNCSLDWHNEITRFFSRDVVPGLLNIQQN